MFHKEKSLHTMSKSRNFMTLQITDYYTHFVTFPVVVRLLFSMIHALVVIAHTQSYTAHKIQGMANLARTCMFSKAIKLIKFQVTLLLVLCKRFMYLQWLSFNKQNPVYQKKGSLGLQFS